MRASGGALFLAPYHPPRGPCLLLLYFGDTRCMMGSQRGPLTLSTHCQIALRVMVAAAEVNSRAAGQGWEAGLEWLRSSSERRRTSMFAFSGCMTTAPSAFFPPEFVFLMV